MERNSKDNERKWGRIFMGTRISELSEVEAERSRAWDEKDETEYLERVRSRATEKAREILSGAEAEAATIRAQAQEEGYAEGIRQAELELEEVRGSMGDAVSAVLTAIQNESAAVTRAWREDLAALVRIAVEKALALTLSQERGKVLETLYLQALKNLEKSRQIIVRVNPEDEAAIEDIIKLGSAGRPELQSWTVKGDPSVTPGGLFVESESSLADNSIESRLAAVEQVLAELNVPEPESGPESSMLAAGKQAAARPVQTSPQPAPQTAPQSASQSVPQPTESVKAQAQAQEQSVPDASAESGDSTPPNESAPAGD